MTLLFVRKKCDQNHVSHYLIPSVLCIITIDVMVLNVFCVDVLMT
jgi:hypothetical protein